MRDLLRGLAVFPLIAAGLCALALALGGAVWLVTVALGALPGVSDGYAVFGVLLLGVMLVAGALSTWRSIRNA